MNPVLSSERGITLIGGGTVEPRHLAAALALAPAAAAADSGADIALENGIEPLAVIGDLDSLSGRARARLGARVHSVAEQDSTDFEKCLLRLSAPVVIGVGFGGPRLDHALAALGALARRIGPPTVLLCGEDAVLACPPQVSADLPPGTRLSLFPMGPARVESEGLRWPTAGIDLAPAGRVGTSNEVIGPLRLGVRGRAVGPRRDRASARTRSRRPPPDARGLVHSSSLPRTPSGSAASTMRRTSSG